MMHYKSNFEMCKNNLKAWKLIGTIIKKKGQGSAITNKSYNKL